jgi:hypothetical protein
MQSALVQEYSRQASDLTSQGCTKITLRREWVDECIEWGKVLGEEENWGGWEVK